MSFTIQKAPPGQYHDPEFVSITLDENLVELGLDPSQDFYLDDNQLYPDPSGKSVHIDSFFTSNLAPVDTQAINQESLENFLAVLKLLDKQKSDILKLRYGLEGIEKEKLDICRQFNISPAELEIIEAEALTELYSYMVNYELI